MINIISLLLLFTVGLNYYAVGDKLLTNLQDKFNEVKDLSAEFKQSTNGKSVISGKFFFKKEDKLRIEFKNSILMSDGSTNWNYNQKENKVIISKNDDNNASPFSLRKVIFDYPKECLVSSEMENGIEVLVLIPNKESSIGYSLIKIWVNNENLINRILLKDKADNLTQIDFSKYKVNQKITDSKFNFTPPEGSKVIDLR
jgi:outer membrane lipoprotein carrier protein